MLALGLLRVVLGTCSNAAEAGGEVDEGTCAAWASAGECEANANYMHAKCSFACGCPSSTNSSAACEDRDKTGACASWAASGECEANPSYMRLKCAASCGTCELLDYKVRCPIDPELQPAVPPGAMAETFSLALSNFAEYEPQLLSTDPPVLTLENFVQPDEVDALLEHAEGRFERSTASGGRKGDEFVPLTSEIRTSHTTWCNTPGCLGDERVKRLMARMEAVTRVPTNNSEFIQLLRYEACAHPRAKECQFYRRHHDTIPELGKMQCGPRVYTMFLYLSDVEEGGGTKFDLGFTITPKKGRAVLWPATKNDEPFVSDDRTYHEALPVTKGTKYAANFWLHQYDYVTPHHSGCTA